MLCRNCRGNIARVAIEELFAPMLLGQESHRVEGLWEEMYRETILHGRAGTVMRALSILDIALWDLNARAVELPLYRYLGCWTTERVPAYASGGYYLEGKTPRNLGEELAGYVRQGFRAVKMKAGRLTPAQEEERVRAAREAIGPDVLLMLDVNNAWSDLPTALLYCKRFEKYDIYWVEEPFSPDDIENHARLAVFHRYYSRHRRNRSRAMALQGNPGKACSRESCRRMRPSAAESPSGAGSRKRRPATT